MSDDAPTIDPAAVTEQQPEPAQEAPAPTPDKQTSFDADYVAKLRAEAAKYRTEAKANAEAAKRLSEIEESQKTEAQRQAEQLQKLQQENEALRLATVKAQVAAAKGVPAELLAGATEEELTASADALLAFRGQPAQPAPDFGAGSRGDSPAKPKQLTRADMARMTPEQLVAADDAGQFDDLKAGRL